MSESSLHSRAKRTCPICHSDMLCDRGEILHPVPTLVAGVPIDLSGIRFSLCRCENCSFQFKNPEIPPDQLLNCYKNAKSDHWPEPINPRSRYFDVIRELLAVNCSAGKILDIGCFDGALLGYLDAQWDKFGLEPAARAAEVARNRGIKIIGATTDDLKGREEEFNAVLAIDVIEHIPDPLPFFQAISRCLRTGGAALFVTGDTDSFWWRLQASRYWYCSLPEHVSFYCKTTMSHIASLVGMQSRVHLRLSHGRSSLYRRIADNGKNFAYFIGNTAGGLGLPSLRRAFVHRRGPTTLAARDHMFHLMVKQ